MRRALALAIAGLALGCGGNSPPVIGPLIDQPAYVDRELHVTLTAHDPDGDPLSFSFASQLPNIQTRATLEPSGAERALFSWTPLASDIGAQPFDFSASDGQATATGTLVFDVKLGGESSSAPRFVQPLGTGTTLDFDKGPCLEVALVVEDDDSAMVAIAQEEPLLPGAKLAPSGPLAAKWSWCPSAEQAKADDHYVATFSADDGQSAKALKNYLVVLRHAPGSGKQCPGAGPAVSHKAEDVSSLVDVPVTASIGDAYGLKYAPLLYYGATDPGAMPDLAAMTQLTMKLASGDMKNGNWSATLPNPVAKKSAGAKGDLYYVIVAEDNGAAQGSCDHLSQAPASGAYHAVVTNPGGAGGLGLCASCSADSQCGGDGDNCVYMSDGFHCFIGCNDATKCPMGFYCSFSQFSSIDGAKARQCIPNDYKCAAMQSCKDDGYEPNDTLAQAKPLAKGSFPLESCAGNDDWFKITVAADAKVDLSVASNGTSDIDLALTDKYGAVLKKSNSSSSNESLSACLGAGSYYVHVYAWLDQAASYTLSFQSTAQKCALTCQDDGAEPDNNAAQARLVDLNVGKYTSKNNMVCSMNDDWFKVMMYQGETLHAKLAFNQSSEDEDLDLYIYDVDGKTNLTGCSEAAPLACDPDNGQGAVSNEIMSWPIAKTGSYYLVVHGWAGAQNHYDLCVGLSSADCP